MFVFAHQCVSLLGRLSPPMHYGRLRVGGSLAPARGTASPLERGAGSFTHHPRLTRIVFSATLAKLRSVVRDLDEFQARPFVRGRCISGRDLPTLLRTITTLIRGKPNHFSFGRIGLLSNTHFDYYFKKNRLTFTTCLIVTTPKSSHCLEECRPGGIAAPIVVVIIGGCLRGHLYGGSHEPTNGL